MKLSDGEKLILLMLADICKSLKIEGGEFDPGFIKEAIYSDYPWAFNWHYAGVPFATQEDPPEVKETANFLEMWNLIENSYANLPPDDKKRVETGADPFPPQLAGFDAYHEPHYGIARFFIEKLERFERFKGRKLNSHAPVVPAYRRMYELFEQRRESIDIGQLGVDDLIQLLSAQRPD
jgi:uncharacterized protein